MESRGQVNYYTPYNHSSLAPGIHTVNLANGVTPFVLILDGKEYHSSMYRFPSVTRMIITIAWYRPTKMEWDKLETNHVHTHILNAGLLHKELGKAVTLPDDPTEVNWGFEQFQEFCLKTYGRRLEKMEF